MQGHHNHEVGRYEYVNIDSFIPNNHILKKIDKNIDLSFIKELTRENYSPDNGRPSIDPEVFFRIMLLGHLLDINSDRKLCKAIHFNIAYRWFCKLNLMDKIPDHSSITRIRDRLGVDIFEKIFRNIVNQCKEKGLIGSKRVITDATLFQANASINSMIPRDPTTKEEEKTEVVPGIIPPTPKKLANKTHVSRTDPDSSLAFKKGEKRGLKYKAHVSIDSKERIILDVDITTGSTHESQVYTEQLSRIEIKYNFKIEDAIADKAYGSAKIIQYLIDKGINPYIPLFSSRSGGLGLKEADGFIYNKDDNFYICPAGNTLTPYPTIQDNRIMYRSSAKNCATCNIKDKCKAPLFYNHKDTRIVTRNVHHELFHKTREEMKTKKFKEALSERMWKVEGVVGDLKLKHGLARAKYRGLIKTQIQAYLAATIINVKRIATFLCEFFLSLICKNFKNKKLLVIFIN